MHVRYDFVIELNNFDKFFFLDEDSSEYAIQYFILLHLDLYQMKIIPLKRKFYFMFFAFLSINDLK